MVTTSVLYREAGTCYRIFMTKKPVLLSGIKPTGDPHIGNYFGALKQFVDMQNKSTHECYFMIADYHALNSVQNGDEMRRLTHELALTFLAIGIDPKKAVLFKQSDVPAHTELAWIFDTFTTMPYLMRAHAYKDAEAKSKELSVGTFNYPMLMAADILLYDTSTVPVGQDQKQHVEYARDAAEKFNRIYGNIFRLPTERIVPEVAVVPGTDGKKMSKSHGNTIPLFATREEITQKVMGIVTDSDGDVPTNVYAIHKLVKSAEELAPLYEEHRGRYKTLKDTLVDDLDAFITPMRARYLELAKNPAKVSKFLERGGVQARKKAEEKIAQVRKAVGVR